jgi:O-antigen/teichoic acid export membrane protein
LAASSAAEFNGRLEGGVLKNVTTVFGGTSVARFIGLVTTWLLVRNLAPNDFGIFSIIDMVAGLSAGLLTTGFNWSMIKWIAANRNDDSKAWGIARSVLVVEIVYALILALILYVTASMIATQFFKKPEIAPFLKLCSIGVIGSVLLGYRNSIFQAFSRFKLDAAFTVGHSLSYMAIVVFLLVTQLFTIKRVTIFYVCIPVLVSSIALFPLLKNLLRVRVDPSFSFSRTIGNTYFWLLCYTLCQWFVGQFHIMILTRYAPMEEIGYYGFAYRIYSQSLILMNSINIVLLPTFSRSFDSKTLKSSFQRVLKATAIVAVCFLVSIPFLGYFVHLFAGPAYAGATPMLQVLIFGAATSTMLSPPVNVLFALDKFTTIAVGGIMLLIINLVGHLMITRYYGGIGAASVQVASHLLLNSYFTFSAYRGVNSATEY